MRRFFAILAFLLLVLALLEPVLPPPVVPAWPGRVTTSQAAQSAMSRPAEALSAGRVRSLPPTRAVFREALLEPPASLIPLLPGGDNAVTRLLFRGLAGLDADGRPQPDLAVNWSVKGGTEWRVRLQPGLLWHDGEPVTAADVVFTFTAAAHPALQELAGDGALAEQVRRRARLWAGRRVEALDAETVQIILAAPDASLPYDLTLPLLPAHVLGGTPDPRDWAATPFATAPVGTGFFRWAGDADGTISLQAFQQGGLWPTLAGYQFSRVSGADEAWQALQAGKLDGAAFDVPPTIIDAAGAQPLVERAIQLRLGSSLSPTSEALLLLWSATSDPALRRAVAPALAAWDTGLWPPYPPKPTPGQLQPFDDGQTRLQQAAAALDQLGWLAGADGWRQRDGRPLQFLVDLSAGTAASLPVREAAVAAIVRPLHGLGIRVVPAAGATTAVDRQSAHLAAQLVLWEGGGDPDLANLVAAIPDAPDDLLRQAVEPRLTLDDARRSALLESLAARLQSEHFVTPLAGAERVLVFGRSVPDDALAWLNATHPGR